MYAAQMKAMIDALQTQIFNVPLVPSSQSTTSQLPIRALDESTSSYDIGLDSDAMWFRHLIRL